MSRNSNESRGWPKWRLRTVLAVGALVVGLVYLVPIAATSTNIRHFPTFNGTDIIDGTLSGRDIKNNSLTPADFRGGKRAVRGQRGPAGRNGTNGTNGTNGAQGPPGFSVLNYVTAAPFSVPDDGQVHASRSNCPAGQYPVGGGVATATSDMYVNETRPDRSQNGWLAYVRNLGGAPANMRVYVVCAPAATVTGGT